MLALKSVSIVSPFSTQEYSSSTALSISIELLNILNVQTKSPVNKMREDSGFLLLFYHASPRQIDPSKANNLLFSCARCENAVGLWDQARWHDIDNFSPTFFFKKHIHFSLFVLLTVHAAIETQPSPSAFYALAKKAKSFEICSFSSSKTDECSNPPCFRATSCQVHGNWPSF